MSNRPSESVEPIHAWFGLTYTNYLVLPRAVLQSMPLKWQQQFVACLEELDEATGDLPTDSVYDVRVLAREPELIHPPCEECDGAGEDDEGNKCERCGGEGDADDSPRHETAEEVGFKPDPIPHYNRGRTRLDLEPGGP
jgi:hypothetical protein